MRVVEGRFRTAKPEGKLQELGQVVQLQPDEVGKLSTVKGVVVGFVVVALREVLARAIRHKPRAMAWYFEASGSVARCAACSRNALPTSRGNACIRIFSIPWNALKTSRSTASRAT